MSLNSFSTYSLALLYFADLYTKLGRKICLQVQLNVYSSHLRKANNKNYSLNVWSSRWKGQIMDFPITSTLIQNFLISIHIERQKKELFSAFVLSLKEFSGFVVDKSQSTCEVACEKKVNTQIKDLAGNTLKTRHVRALREIWRHCAR